MDIYEVADRLWDDKPEVRTCWSKTSLRIWLRDSCQCVYCDTDLLVNRGICYCFFSEDHLLPRSVYPQLEWEIENRLLCCRHCNLIKRDYDPNIDGQPIYVDPDSRKLTREQAGQLRKRAKTYVKQERERLTRSFERAKELILEKLNSR